jgi:hypothetical protein
MTTPLRQRVLALTAVIALSVGIAAGSGSTAFAVDAANCDKPGYPACASRLQAEQEAADAAAAKAAADAAAAAARQAAATNAANAAALEAEAAAAAKAAADAAAKAAAAEAARRQAEAAAVPPAGGSTGLNSDGTLKTPPVATVTRDITNARNSGNYQQTTLSQVLSSRLPGFAANAPVIVHVLGSLTVSAFNVPSNVTAEQLRAAIEAAFSAYGSSITSFTASVLPNRPTVIPSGTVSQDASDSFSHVGLATPITLAELIATGYTGPWVQVQTVVRNLFPGTIVYLALTSQPVILGAAVVGQDGTAKLSGFLPVDALPAGDHRVRVVGTHDYEGVSADGSGQAKLSDAAMKDIQGFDKGTQVTVIVTGDGANGGTTSLVRVIPVDEATGGFPWWIVIASVALLLLILVLVLVLRRRNKAGETAEVTITTPSA